MLCEPVQIIQYGNARCSPGSLVTVNQLAPGALPGVKPSEMARPKGQCVVCFYELSEHVRD